MKTKPKKREKSTTTKGHYVTNAVLLPAVIEAKALNVVTDKLIKMIYMIADRYSRKANFIGYSFRTDMIAAAVMNLCNNALKFNPEKSSNPFSFYTTAIHNSFLQFIADEKKHRNIRDALLVDAGANPSFNFLEGEKDEIDFDIKDSDDIVVSVRERSIEEILSEDLHLEESPILTSEEAIHANAFVPKEQRIRYASKAPSECITYGPDDLDVDAHGNTIFKHSGEIVFPALKPKK